MVARQENTAAGRSVAAPEQFRAAVKAMHAARLRPEVACEEMPAPQRIAPWSSALSAEVTVDGDDVGTGRLILLHDPAGNDSWDGTFRCVAYVRAEIETEAGHDPFLGAVGWSWLVEALEAHGADYSEAAGSITRVATENFGAMSATGPTASMEIRASWTPVVADDIGAHVEAWGELLCTVAGLPPVPEGVATMPSRRGQRGR